MDARILLAGAAALAAPAALAAGIGISPVMVQLAPGEKAAAMTVTNSSEATVVLQVDPFRWSQPHGEDLYEEDAAIVATPPLFRLPPGGKQVVRVGFPGGVPRAGGGAYRVYFQEVASEAAVQPGAVQWLLRIGVPFFVAPAGAADRAAHWQARVEADGRLGLTIHNRGNVHLRFTRVRIEDAAGGVLADAQTLLYVLPGATRSLPLPVSGRLRDGMALKVVADMEHGPLTAQFVVGGE